MRDRMTAGAWCVWWRSARGRGRSVARGGRDSALRDRMTAGAARAKGRAQCMVRGGRGGTVLRDGMTAGAQRVQRVAGAQWVQRAARRGEGDCSALLVL